MTNNSNTTAADFDAKLGQVREFLLNLQERICTALENQEKSGGIDGSSNTKFIPDIWEHPEGGGGRSCVMSGGEVIEKGGVMFSHIHISKLPLLPPRGTHSLPAQRLKQWVYR